MRQIRYVPLLHVSPVLSLETLAVRASNFNQTPRNGNALSGLMGRGGGYSPRTQEERVVRVSNVTFPECKCTYNAGVLFKHSDQVRGEGVPVGIRVLFLTRQPTTSGTTAVVVVVDSHIQRIVLATEETTVTQQVSHRPIKRQSRLWSQRGTKVNGSHHGDNPLLRPTGIQIATKSYAALQAMAPTNIKTVHQTSFESNLDRLGMLSPTHDQRSQQKTGKITLQPVLINKSKFLKATHFVQK